MKVYVARSGGHKITKRWCMDIEMMIMVEMHIK
jgi:hypothetical protein